MAAKLRIVADPDTCMASGLCRFEAPAAFGETEDGIVVVLKPDPAPEEEAAVREAAELCPSGAIEIVDEGE